VIILSKTSGATWPRIQLVAGTPMHLRALFHRRFPGDADRCSAGIGPMTGGGAVDTAHLWAAANAAVILMAGI